MRPKSVKIMREWWRLYVALLTLCFFDIINGGSSSSLDGHRVLGENVGFALVGAPASCLCLVFCKAEFSLASLTPFVRHSVP